MVAHHFKGDFCFVYSVLNIHFENFSALCAIIMCILIDRTVYSTVHLTECRCLFSYLNRINSFYKQFHHSNWGMPKHFREFLWNLHEKLSSYQIIYYWLLCPVHLCLNFVFCNLAQTIWISVLWKRYFKLMQWSDNRVCHSSFQPFLFERRQQCLWTHSSNYIKSIHPIQINWLVFKHSVVLLLAVSNSWWNVQN